MAPPIVLVHGYLSPSWFVAPLAWRLEKEGRRVRRVDLSILCLQDVRTLAAELDAEIERILREEGADRCDLVGVSQGGLIGLYYLRFRGGASRVARFAALGSPFQGTWFAAAGVALLGAFSGGIWQMLPSDPLIRELNGAPPPVPSTSICFENDPLVPPSRARLAGAELVVLPKHRFPAAHQGMVFTPKAARAILEALPEI